MKHKTQAIALALLLGILPLLAACVPAQLRTTEQAPAPAGAVATATPESVLTPVSSVATTAPTAQPPDKVPATIPTEDLLAQVQATVPEGAFRGPLVAMPLTVPEGAEPLWAVLSTGMVNYDIEPLPSHFIAIYTLKGDTWEELARLSLDSEEGGPGYVDEKTSQQVEIEPSHIWFMVQGGLGAHGGTFQLVSFDGQKLTVEVGVIASPSPGMGSVQDIDGDGQLEVVLDQSDPYVFCYACGARKVQYQVLRWDEAQKKLVEMTLQALPAGQPQAVADPANRAVELAQAGLWKEAYALIQQAKEASSGNVAVLNQDYALIKLTAEALVATLDIEYPLIQQVFYGDYAAAVDIMRQYAPEKIFSADSPLVVGTMAENFLDSLSQHLLESATAAIEAEPDLAAAYFIRGWGEYLADPTSQAARDDVAKAASLAPEDAFYAGSVTALK